MSDSTSGENTEQYFKQLSTQYQQYKNQLESIKQHLDMVYTSSEECVKTLDTLKNLESMEEGVESMVPIGSGTYMYAQFNDLNRFVVDIGVEKNLEETKQTLNKRKEEMDSAYERLNESYSQVVQNMQEIERQFNEYYSKAQAKQGGYRAQ